VISICIPAYEQFGEGQKHLEILLQSIQKQSFKDYEVCVSDNSGTFKELCDKYGARWQYNNKTFGVSANTNAAIKMARFEVIKLMYQDDWFIEDCLHEFITDTWLVSGFTNYFENGKVMNGMPEPYKFFSNTTSNKIGMPSVISFKKCAVKFNTQLRMALDMDFYCQLFNEYGLPKVLNKHNIAQRIWSKQQGAILYGLQEKIPTFINKIAIMKITLDKKFYGQTAVFHGLNIKLDANTPQHHLEILADKMPHLVTVEYDVVKKKHEDLSEPTQQPTTSTLTEQQKEEAPLKEVLPQPQSKPRGRKPKMAK
jgi:hypothetical protein